MPRPTASLLGTTAETHDAHVRPSRSSVSVASAARALAIDSGFPSPGQQRTEFVGFGLARHNALEDIAQIGEGLDRVKSGRLDQRGEGGPALGPAIGAGKEVVLGAELDRADRALDGIRIDFDAAVF